MNTPTALAKTPMRVTVVLMGFNLQKTLATGAQVFGNRKDTPQKRIEYFMDGTRHSDGANDAFEYSNAPWRCEEWVKRFGPTRSMSVGDVAIVQQNGRRIGFVCAGIGWGQVEGDEAIEAVIAKLEASGNYFDRSKIADELADKE